MLSASHISGLLKLSCSTLDNLTINLKKLPKTTGGHLDLRALSSPSEPKTIHLNTENSLSYNVLMLAHELCHLKQVEDGRLKVIDENTVLWIDNDGSERLYTVIEPNKKSFDEDIKAYRLQPWEAEAYEKQEELHQDCKARFKDYEIELCEGITVPVF